MIPKPTAKDPNNMTTPTQIEKDTCKQEKKVRLIASRKATLKSDILS